MKVLLLISSAGHYGAENMLLALAGGLRKRGCEPVVGAFHNTHRANLEIVEQASALGHATAVFRCRGRVDLQTIRDIAQSIRSERFDVIHTHGYKANMYGYLAAKRTGAPVLATCHSWQSDTLPLYAYSVLDSSFLCRFPKVVAVSEDVRKILLTVGVPSNRVAVIPNGIKLSPFEVARPSLNGEVPRQGGLVVGMVARLAPGKGGNYFLEAAREVLKSHPGTSFVFVGEGRERPRLEQMAREFGVEKNVAFIGQRQDMPGVYASLDILVLPSLSEAMPMCLLEGLSARKAVVATRVGDVPKLILARQTGLLVEPRDTAGLRDAIAELITDSDLRTRLGTSGHDLVETHFSVDKMTSNYLSVYESLRSAH